MMRLLIDTHILLWHLEDNPRLSLAWSALLESPRVEKYFSVASLWEMAVKANIGNLTLIYPLDRIVPNDFQILPIKTSHLLAYQQLPLHHRDPFDRMIIAQAQVEELTVMTQDGNFPLYDIMLL